MDDTLQAFGLPLHPLLVHAVVVLIPLTVLAVLLTQFWPAARRRLGIVTPLSALVVLILMPITVAAGDDLAGLVGPLPAVEAHEAYGRMLLPWAIGLFVVALVQWGWFRWSAAPGRPKGRALDRVAFWVLAAVVLVVAAGTVIVLVLTGDSGARAVWGGLLG